MHAPLIIGGGPAGAAAAAVLAASGHPVRLIERSSGPTDKVCGDFLSVGALDALTMLQIDPIRLGAVPISTLRLWHRGRLAETRLPFPAAGLSRRVLDEALLQHAAWHGAELLRGQSVQRLEPTPAGFVAHASRQGPMPAGGVFLATGKHDLRGAPRPHTPDEPIGLKMYYVLSADQHAELRGCIELIMFRGGYAGLQLVEHGRAVLCLILPARRFRAAGSRWERLLDSLAAESPHIAHRLAGATACLDRPLAVAAIPYGHLHRAAQVTRPGLFRLGDQACVIPSFAGDGVAIALASGMLAARSWLNGHAATAYHQALQGRVRSQLRLASLIHTGCTSGALQPLVAAVSRSWPGAMRLIAAATRIAAA